MCFMLREITGLPGGSDKPSPKPSFKIPKKSPNSDAQNTLKKSLYR